MLQACIQQWYSNAIDQETPGSCSAKRLQKIRRRERATMEGRTGTISILRDPNITYGCYRSRHT